MRNRLSQFVANRNGAVAILTAFALVPIIIAVGAGIEFMRVTALRTNLQNAVDSAALAAMAATVRLGDQGWTKDANGQWQRRTDTSIPQIAADYVQQNFSASSGVNANTTTTPDWSKGTMTVTSKATIPTYLAALANISKFDLSASATATVGNPQTIREIAIAFDVTASMNFEGRKQAAIPAAKDFIHKVMTNADGSPNPNTRVGLVPFNYYVNVGAEFWRNNTLVGLRWLTSTDDIPPTSNCWSETTETRIKYTKTGSEPYIDNCITDGITYPCTKYRTTYSQETYQITKPAGCQTTSKQTWTGCVGSPPPPWDEIDEVDIGPSGVKVPALVGLNTCPSQRIIYLSSNDIKHDGDRITWDTSAETNLQSALDNMTFTSNTYIAPGLLWAWRILSPALPVAGWEIPENQNTNETNLQNELRVLCGDFNPNVYDPNKVTRGLRVDSMEKPACPYVLSEKTIVLMTDGLNVKRAHYNIRGDHEIDDRDSKADTKLSTICSNVKAQGIKIYTIAFMVNNAQTENLLKACATDADHYYNATTTDALTKAFESIGKNMMQLKLIK